MRPLYGGWTDVNKAVEDKIAELVALSANGSEHAGHVQEMIGTLLRLSNHYVSHADIKIIQAALKDMRYAFKLFAPYRAMRKVSVFGSARTLPSDPVYEYAAQFAEKIVNAGFMVITGAGEGIMCAVQKGAGRSKSFGMNIRLPFEQAPNEFIENDPKLMSFKYFFTRKLFFMREANAAALFPGGFGTHDEGFEALTLLQTGKSEPLPVVFVDVPEGTYWKGWCAYVEAELLHRGLISPEDMSLFKMTDQVDVAVAEISGFYKNYHSIRYVGNRLVIRLNHPVSPTLLENLNDLFSDTVVEGTILKTGALSEEADEPDLVLLPRMVFNFNRRSFGRLRQMIDVINRY